MASLARVWPNTHNWCSNGLQIWRVFTRSWQPILRPLAFGIVSTGPVFCMTLVRLRQAFRRWYVVVIYGSAAMRYFPWFFSIGLQQIFRKESRSGYWRLLFHITETRR